MKEKILAALKIKFKNLGFGDKAFEGVAEFLATTTTEEGQIETAIVGVEPLLKSFQGDIDRRVNEAVLKAKAEGARQPEGGKETNDDGERTDIQKAVEAALAPVLKEVEALKAGKASEAFQNRLNSVLKEKGIPEKYYSKIIVGRQFKDEAEVDSFAGEVELGWKDFEQHLTEQGFSKQEKPILGVVNEHGVSSATQQYIEGRTASTDKASDLGGKKL